MFDQPVPDRDLGARGTLDGCGAADHDQPFVGFRSYHFTTRQLARLLHLRSELLDARLGHGRWTQDLAASCS
jgi:hypothetical protein